MGNGGRLLALALFLAFAPFLPAAAYEFSLSYPQNDSWTALGNSSLNFTFKYSNPDDSGSVCTLYLNNMTVGTVNAINNTQTNVSSAEIFLQDSNFWFIGCMNQTTQNSGNSSRMLFHYDPVAPVLISQFPVNNFNSSSANVTFNITTTDNLNLTSLELLGNWNTSGIAVWHVNKTNSTPYNNSVWSFNVSGIPDGRYLWAARATDAAGSYILSANFTITVDTTSPSITPLFANDTNYTNLTFPAFSFLVSDALLPASGCTLKILGASNTSQYNVTAASGYCNFTSINMTMLLEGRHMMIITANDTLGNTATNDSFTIGIDATAPKFSSGIPANGTLYLGNVSFAPSFSETVNMTWLVNETGGNESSATGVDFFPVNSYRASGSYQWTILIRDSSGNSNYTTFNFTVNTTRPYVNLTYPADGFSTKLTSFDVQFNATDDSASLSCSVLLDGAVNQTNASVLKYTTTNFTLGNLAYATHTWQVSCTNGTATAYSVPRTFRTQFLGVTSQANSTMAAFGQVLNLSASVRSLSAGTNGAWLAWSLPSGWSVLSNSTDAGSMANQTNATNATLAFGSLFWNNLTVRVGNLSTGLVQIAATANSSHGFGTVEAANVTIYALSANGSFSSAVNLTEERSLNFTFQNNGGAQSDNVTAFNLTFNPEYFNVTDAAGITSGWLCDFTGYYANCSGAASPSGNLTIVKLTLKAGILFGNSTAILDLLGTMGSRYNYTIAAPEIKGAGGVFTNVTAVRQGNTSLHMNLSVRNWGIMSLSAFNGTFPTVNITTLNVTGYGGGLTCGNLTGSNVSFNCTGLLSPGQTGYVVLQITANANSLGTFAPNLIAHNSTGKLFSLDSPNITITQAPIISGFVNVPASVSLDSNVTLLAGFSNCISNPACANLTSVAATWSVTGTGCRLPNNMTTYSGIYLESGTSYTVPSQSTFTSSSVTTCNYTLTVTGVSADTGTNFTTVAFTNSVIIVNTTSGSTGDPPGPGPVFTEPAIHLSLSPTSVVVSKGDRRYVTATVTLSDASSLAGTLSLVQNSSVGCCSVSISPSSFSGITNTSSRIFNVTVNVASTASAGSYPLVLKSSIGAKSSAATLTIVVQYPTTTTIAANATGNQTANQTGNVTLPGSATANGTMNLTGNGTVISNRTLSEATKLLSDVNRTVLALIASDSSLNSTYYAARMKEVEEFLSSAAAALAAGNSTAYEDYVSKARAILSDVKGQVFWKGVGKNAPIVGILLFLLLLLAAVGTGAYYLALRSGNGPPIKIDEVQTVLGELADEVKEPLDKKKTKPAEDGGKNKEK